MCGCLAHGVGDELCTCDCLSHVRYAKAFTPAAPDRPGDRDQQQAAECHHCGSAPDLDGDHSCPCPKRDEDCTEHPLDAVARAIADASDAGPLSDAEWLPLRDAYRNVARVARAAARAEEAARWQAKIEALITFYDRHEYSSVSVDDLRALLDGER